MRKSLLYIALLQIIFLSSEIGIVHAQVKFCPLDMIESEWYIGLLHETNDCNLGELVIFNTNLNPDFPVYCNTSGCLNINLFDLKNTDNDISRYQKAEVNSPIFLSKNNNPQSNYTYKIDGNSRKKWYEGDGMNKQYYETFDVVITKNAPNSKPVIVRYGHHLKSVESTVGFVKIDNTNVKKYNAKIATIQNNQANKKDSVNMIYIEYKDRVLGKDQLFQHFIRLGID